MKEVSYLSYGQEGKKPTSIILKSGHETGNEWIKSGIVYG